jgi:hypothetical protein
MSIATLTDTQQTIFTAGAMLDGLLMAIRVSHQLNNRDSGTIAIRIGVSGWRGLALRY